MVKWIQPVLNREGERALPAVGGPQQKQLLEIGFGGGTKNEMCINSLCSRECNIDKHFRSNSDDNGRP